MKFKQLSTVLGLVVMFSLGGIVGAKADSIYEKIVAYKDYSIQLKVHGKRFQPQNSDGEPITPITYNNTTYLPVRAISSAVGLPIDWDQVTKTASIGYDSIQLNNYSSTSIVNIEINGGWTPTYLTNERKRYSNSYMGVDFEIKNLNGQKLSDVVKLEKNNLSKYGFNVKISEIVLSDLTGSQMEYQTYSNGTLEGVSKKVYLASNNSDEYYVIYVFITESKYEENKEVIEKIINSFEKQK